ncbi:MAG: 3-deoxy-manno-octulosonate cytidylyltransferase [Alphaproteobacteria bacterium GM202ARS2]|nr:3-deoxy-manno-octulosonate cytidylyltransferase [Alphaproteobacteria bacterium GM202ARS2]
MTPETLIVIPARLQSSRLNHKILQNIDGEPLLVHTLRHAQQAKLAPIVVACDDERTMAVCRKLGIDSVMTESTLASGSDRIAAALQAYDPDRHAQYIINIQADLPDISARAIHALYQLLVADNPQEERITTLVSPLDERDTHNPHVVKAAISWYQHNQGRALYFSRNAIPASNGALYHHIGVYGYTRSALETFCALPPSPLEQHERLEQLRALEAGLPIYAEQIPVPPASIDTQDDLDRFREHKNR